MSVFTTNSEILTRFKTNWDANFPAVPVSYPNAPFDPPENTEWVRVSIANGNSAQRTIGGTSNSWRANGFFTVQIFVPLGTSTGTAANIADSVSSWFRGADTDHVQFRNITVTELGASQGWYQVNVSVSFQDAHLY